MVIKPKDKRNIFISGLFLTALFALLVVFIFSLSRESSLFSEKILVHTKVENANNLKTGAAVQLKGIRIGGIRNISFSGLDEITVTLQVEKKFQKWIKQDSYVDMKTQGVLGDRYVEILGGSEEAPTIASGEFIKTKESSQLNKFIDKGEGILDVSTRVLKRIDLLIAALEANRLESIFANLEQSTARTNKILKGLEDQNIGELLKRVYSASGSLDDTAKRISSISERIEKGPGTIHSLIYDRSVHDDIKSLLGGARRNKILRYFIRESIKESDN